MPKIVPVHWKVLEKVFLEAGFRFVRQKGSHRSYFKAGIARPVVIPTYAQVPVSIIRNNLKTARIDREEYLRLMQQRGSRAPKVSCPRSLSEYSAPHLECHSERSEESQFFRPFE